MKDAKSIIERIKVGTQTDEDIDMILRSFGLEAVRFFNDGDGDDICASNLTPAQMAKWMKVMNG